ncbi:MAG: shikimate kinase [Proteobacteria bacterium]|uniref:shikimate kinase n=1 Tax=Rudaea sp. TaxID=2136325 RepID=UPI00321FFA97|nr:shikimate kinase [Pseudomonadota bacterium]
MNPAPSLFLIGPMGAGKTTVGRRVAAQLGLDFHDLDHEIEERSGATVTLIFELEGEAGFRKREAELLGELSGLRGIVLSTGGGAVLSADNRRHLRERGYVVYLETTIEQQLKRLAHDRKRPLLAAPDRRAKLARLAAEREPLYRETADLVVPTGLNGSSGATARRLVEELNTQWQRSATQAAPERTA